MRVFIADDSSIIRERLVTMITAIPDSEVVGQAATINDARPSIHQLRPDVVILDIQMPGGSGIDLLQELKQNATSPLVLMITTNAFPQYRKKCLEAGADYFFDKATEIQLLQETLCQLQSRFTTKPPPQE